jgi:hypothetical protein
MLHRSSVPFARAPEKPGKYFSIFEFHGGLVGASILLDVSRDGSRILFCAGDGGHRFRAIRH